MTNDSTVLDSMRVINNSYGRSGANIDTYYRFEVAPQVQALFYRSTADNIATSLTAADVLLADTVNSTRNRNRYNTLPTRNYELYTELAYEFHFRNDLNLRVACRRGYKDAYMNTDDVLWDASLSRTFLKNALTVKVNAHDILGQISNVNYSVNAQGRTETWTNTITRYVMLSVSYRFSKNPKKKL